MALVRCLVGCSGEHFSHFIETSNFNQAYSFALPYFIHSQLLRSLFHFSAHPSVGRPSISWSPIHFSSTFLASSSFQLTTSHRSFRNFFSHLQPSPLQDSRRQKLHGIVHRSRPSLGAARALYQQATKRAPTRLTGQSSLAASPSTFHHQTSALAQPLRL